MKKGVYIRNPSDARRLLSRMINDCCMEKVKTDTLRAVSYAVSVLMKIFETDELDKRVAELERKRNEKKPD